METFSFQPEVKGTCISKKIYPALKFHPGVNFTSPACNMSVTVLRFKGTIGEFVDDFLVLMDTEEQWDLDVAVNKYPKFLVACYNRLYHTLNGENPIPSRHSKATTGDLMVKHMSENNWHQFLSDFIRGALDNPQAADQNGHLNIDVQWIRNIFRRLHNCF